MRAGKENDRPIFLQPISYARENHHRDPFVPRAREYSPSLSCWLRLSLAGDKGIKIERLRWSAFLACESLKHFIQDQYFKSLYSVEGRVICYESGGCFCQRRGRLNGLRR